METLLGYIGAVAGLVLLWQFRGRRPFWQLRWFAILPSAVLGAAVLAFPVVYRRAAASAAMGLDIDVDLASLLGEAVGLGVSAGGVVAAVALIGNTLKRKRIAQERR